MSEMVENQTDYEVHKGAGWITLNRPANRNALTPQLICEVYDHIQNALGDDDVRCIVITGAGEAFCAGADLKGSGGPPQNPSERRVTFPQLLTAIMDCPKPVIAAVNGSAFGGGLGLVGASDIIVTATSAKFSFSEVRIGVIPAIISVVCLPKLGRHHGMKLFLTGERFDGEQAVELGLAHLAVDAADLRDTVQDQIDMICLGGPNALIESKKLVRTVIDMPEADAFERTAGWSASMFRSEEAQEGMAAFREKRKPAWVS